MGNNQMTNNNYSIVRKMPKGWKVLLNATTAPKGHVWITNNKPQFSGKRKYALLKTDKSMQEIKSIYDCIGER